MLKRGTLGIVLAVLVTATAWGKIKLPAIIGNNMVLQQQSEVPLWGGATANTSVKVVTSWNHKTYTIRSDAAGNWRVMVGTPAAGGPYTISFSDGAPLTLKDILIGEVWVCSGQSNMEISMKGYRNTPILHSNDILMNAGDSQLRLFHVQRAVSNTPLADCKGDWEISTPESASTFSAVGFQFAKMMQQILKVPVGVIEAAWGGTPIEAWMDKESLATFPRVKTPSEHDTLKADRLRPTCLFNGMIAPIVGFGIKGFIWYQGEANISHPGSHPYNYDKMMASMVRQWRERWDMGSLPFYYVQIAPWIYRRNRDSAAYLREAQQRALKEIPDAGMVVSIDVGSKYTVHPPDKTTISKRLLYLALDSAYHKGGIACQSPLFDKMKIKGSTVLLSFTNAPHGFFCTDSTINGFEIAGKDKVFHPAKATIYKNFIRVEDDEVTDPASVRYGFKDWVKGDLYNTEGLPVAPFRTDHW
jgi:sialate O-acetylesterase